MGHISDAERPNITDPLERWEFIYGNVEDRDDVDLQEESIRWWKRLIEQCQPEPKRMLDVGTGLGKYARLFAREGFEVTAIDWSANAIGAAELMNLHETNPPTFIHENVSNLSQLGFAECSFGFILDRACSQVLPAEHQPVHFETVSRLLGESGIFFYMGLEPHSDAWHPVAPLQIDKAGVAELVHAHFEIDDYTERPSINLPDTTAFEYRLRPKR